MSRVLLYCAGGVLLVLLPFAGVLFDPSRAFLYRDISNVWMPFLSTWVSAVQQLGRIPHWESLHTAGYRFIADLNYGPLYPLNWMLLASSVKDIPRSLTLWIIFHHCLIFLGQFLFFRDLRIRPWLALLGGLALAWSGPVLSSDCLLHQLRSQAAIGFFFLFWRRALRAHRGFLFAASLALAWPIFGGDPQYTVFMALGAGILAYQARASRLFIFLVGLTVLAASPQIIPTAHQLSTTTRILDAESENELLLWSLHPARLGELLFPLPFGSDPEHYTAADLLNTSIGMPFIFSQYASCLLVALAIFHFFLKRRRRILSAGIFLFLLFLSLGSYSPIPLYPLFMKIVPLWRSFRSPERIAFWLVYAIQFYGMLGAEKALRLLAQKIRLPWKLPALAIGFLSLGYGLWLSSRGVSTSPVWHSLLLCALLFPAFAMKRQAQAALFGLLFLADLAPFAHKLVWDQPVSFASPESYPWAEKILADRARPNKPPAEAGRFFSLITTALSPPQQATGPLVASTYGTWAGMKFNAPTAWGIPVVREHSIMALDRPVLHISGLSGNLARRTLNLLSTRYMLRSDLVASVNKEALPEAFFPSGVEAMKDTEYLEARLKDESWDPAHTALVEHDQAQGTNSSPAEIIRFDRRWDEVVLTVRSSTARWLVLNEAHDPAWRASIAGRELPISRANGWAMAVPVPESTHDIEITFLYRDRWYEAGLCALLLWLALLIWNLRSFLQRRPMGIHPPKIA